ncbi:MAG: AraC family transcriptional regulator [Verrucomicrobiota bacterium]
MIKITGTEIDLPLLIEAAADRSPGAERLGWHSHEGVQLVFLITGATTYELAAGRTLDLPGGHFLVVPARAPHRGLNNVRMPSEVTSLTFNLRRRGKSPALPFTRPELDWMGSCFEEAGAGVYPFGPAVKPIIQYLKAEIVAWNGSQTTCDRRARLRMLVCAHILEAAREVACKPVERPNEIVGAAVEYLRTHLDEPLSVAALTKHLGFSRARVFELFTAETGLAPHHYLIRLRLEKATELLRNTRQSITEIALATGFASGQHLSRVFRTYHGETPSACRESVNGLASAAASSPARNQGLQPNGFVARATAR